MKRLLILVVMALISTAALAANVTYRFSPVNQWDITKTAAYWNPIVQYVENQSGVRLELKIGRTSADTTSYVLAQEVEFVFSNHLFSPERDQLGWKVFGRRWTPPLHAQIAVPEDSPIRRCLSAARAAPAAAAPVLNPLRSRRRPPRASPLPEFS